jgi:hypothetical protein
MKVSFDGENKLITILTGVTDIDVRVDMYLEWKKWVLESDNSKWLAAFRAFGGDPTTPSQNAPSYFFLTNGWRVVATDVNVVVHENLYSDDYANPYIVTNSSVLSKNSDIPNLDSGITYSLSGISYQIENLSTDLDVGLSGISNQIDLVAIDIKLILGLVQHNYRLSSHVYDSEHRLTFVVIKLFNSKSDCDSNINEFATYNMNAVYNFAGELVDYKVTRI